MRCPICGSSLALELAAGTEPDEQPDDPIAPVVRRLEAEQYGNPEPLPRSK